jgi:protein-L-isoaspartate(D-aspartate) O-methyltransferase
MNFDLLRHNMVAAQLEARGIRDARVLAAMGQVPREEFLPAELRAGAYDDLAKPIGLEQTISQPYTVAFMCQAAELAGDETVLEVGTGSGYGAAVLSLLAKTVHTIERIDSLYQSAKARLARLGYANVCVHRGDGSLGWPHAAPYDAIVVTAGAESLPEAYLEQLIDGGRIVVPIGPSGHQQMIRLTRRADQWQEERLGSFGFVPLVEGDRSE